MLSFFNRCADVLRFVPHLNLEVGQRLALPPAYTGAAILAAKSFPDEVTLRSAVLGVRHPKHTKLFAQTSKPKKARQTAALGTLNTVIGDGLIPPPWETDPLTDWEVPGPDHFKDSFVHLNRRGLLL